MSKETGDWMWSKPSTPGQPRDIAYALGSKIVRSYFDNANDTSKALRDIISVVDYVDFLEKSGYSATISGE